MVRLRVAAALVAIGVVAATAIVVVRSRSHDGCTWDRTMISSHVEALAAAPESVVDRLTKSSSVLGDSDVTRNDETDSTRDLTSVASPMACADLGASFGAVAQTAPFSRDPFGALVDVVALSSWGAVDDYVARSSFVASRQVNILPERVFAGDPSPYAHRQESVGGHPGWDLYCFATASGRCDAWSLLARSASCRSLVIDIELHIGESGRQFDSNQAIETLVPAAESAFSTAESKLGAVPCSKYSGRPSGRSWTPPAA